MKDKESEPDFRRENVAVYLELEPELIQLYKSRSRYIES